MEQRKTTSYVSGFLPAKPQTQVFSVPFTLTKKTCECSESCEFRPVSLGCEFRPE